MYKEGYFAAISEYDRHCTIKYSEYAMGSTDLGLSLTVNRNLSRSQREKGSDEFYRSAVVASSKVPTVWWGSSSGGDDARTGSMGPPTGLWRGYLKGTLASRG